MRVDSRPYSTRTNNRHDIPIPVCLVMRGRSVVCADAVECGTSVNGCSAAHGLHWLGPLGAVSIAGSHTFRRGSHHIATLLPRCRPHNPLTLSRDGDAGSYALDFLSTWTVWPPPFPFLSQRRVLRPCVSEVHSLACFDRPRLCRLGWISHARRVFIGGSVVLGLAVVNCL